MTKAGRPPYCKNSGRMSGVFGQKLGRKKSRTGGRISSLTYCSISPLVLRQEK